MAEKVVYPAILKDYIEVVKKRRVYVKSNPNRRQRPKPPQ